MQVECECGTTTHIRLVFSKYGPLNRERESGNCVSCGKEIIVERCLSIITARTEAEADAQFEARRRGA